ncbi:hypothetical protein J6590_074850 [Homalodisca vitripennis]|nr:hypothetical protein J6590_074850 [Homalodisca vitripennis]
MSNVTVSSRSDPTRQDLHPPTTTGPLIKSACLNLDRCACPVRNQCHLLPVSIPRETTIGSVSYLTTHARPPQLCTNLTTRNCPALSGFPCSAPRRPATLHSSDLLHWL